MLAFDKPEVSVKYVLGKNSIKAILHCNSQPITKPAALIDLLHFLYEIQWQTLFLNYNLMEL